MDAGQPLTVYGEGTQTRSFQYVTDLVNGMITTMEGEHVGPFNIGNPGEFTMIELVRVLSPALGRGEQLTPQASGPIFFDKFSWQIPQPRSRDMHLCSPPACRLTW